MTNQVKNRSNCRICGSAQLKEFLNLPDMPMIDDYLRQEALGTEFIWPIRIFLCLDCGQTQTAHDIDEKKYYDDYQYAPSLSPFTQHFMQRLAEEIWRRYQFKPGDTVIEIGSSDGSQLSFFKKLGANVLGFEFSTPLGQESRRRGVEVVQREFGDEADQDIPADRLPVQVVITTYTFDHLPDPMGFLRSVKKVLDPQRGILVIEVHDLETMIERREFCLFAHEHPGYYSTATMQMVLERAGFELIETDLIPEAERRGNSLLIAATPKGSKLASRALPTLPLDPKGLEPGYQEFGRSVNDCLDRLRQFVKSKREAGIRLAGYGTGGRGVMTLAAIGQPDDFAYVCDKNPGFHGLYTPGSHINISSPERLLTDPVDEVIVFSFGYFQEISEELQEFRSRGGRLISLLDIL
ncbi:MAG TPA: class I SAM-dependent methyltransferase [Pyrinomonadaceae bacterium]|nr:class I SAM-dependent methyltransferase [Pyrinomonadaceae bacterium]